MSTRGAFKSRLSDNPLYERRDVERIAPLLRTPISTDTTTQRAVVTDKDQEVKLLTPDIPPGGSIRNTTIYTDSGGSQKCYLLLDANGVIVGGGYYGADGKTIIEKDDYTEHAYTNPEPGSSKVWLSTKKQSLYTDNILTAEIACDSYGHYQSRTLYNTDGVTVKEKDVWVNGYWQKTEPTPGPSPSPEPSPAPGPSPAPEPSPAPKPNGLTGGLSQQEYSTLVSQLGDAGIQSKVVSIANSGKSLLTYDSMRSILENVSASIGSGGLTQSQLRDMQTLVDELGKVSGKNNYLYGISYSLVNGNPANAYWTGGSWQSSALGNLNVGSNQNQLDHLISKWFLGGDLPSTYGGWTNGGAHVQDNKPLFSAGGTPLMSDVGQGAIGDCYFLAAAAEVAKFEPEIIKSMFTDNGNGTYGVRFYNSNMQAVYVTVNKSVYAGGAFNAPSTQAASWVPLLEKAYVEYRSEFNPSYNNYNLINGGWGEGLRAITGHNVSGLACNDNQIIAALNNKQEVLYACNYNTRDQYGNQQLVGGHMFSLEGYDAQTGQFILRNPWGNGWGHDVEFEVSSATLGSYGSLLVADKSQPAGFNNQGFVGSSGSVGSGYVTADNHPFGDPFSTSSKNYSIPLAVSSIASKAFAFHA